MKWEADHHARRVSNFARYACVIRDLERRGEIVAKVYGDTAAEAEGRAALAADAMNRRERLMQIARSKP